MSDEELLETYRASVNKAMDEASARDGFATNMSRESIVAGLRAVFDMSKGEKRAEWEAEQEKTEWEGIVLGREVGGSGDWSVTVWRPDEIEEARAMFPGSEYVLGRAKWLPVPDTTNNESEGKA